MIFSRRNASWLGTASLCACFTAASLVLSSGSVKAERISNPVAVFAGIDKITGRITSFDVYIDETVQFGALQVTPKVCYSRDEAEAQKVDAFIEVDEITLDRKIRRIFSGWMFADSPALNAVEHPIYDVWLKDCKTTSDVPAPDGAKPAQPAPVAAAEPPKAVEAAPAQDIGAEALPADATENLDAVQTLEVPPLDSPQVIEDIPQGEAAPQLPGAPLVKPGSVGLF